ncbi:uncharacterized protein C9orf85 homolog [Aplysia californica]|uniref:Uncharacterized protein C9orf85 homolog n=1 Tax=Aplysia californica TaxID=6500 RepID=A0ABM0JGK5_APLCA|nr:uncharacterized protein C9orf85 homolog [Aplysia californica]
MSSQRGNVSRTRRQKHQNSSSFKNDMHDTSGKMKMIKSLSPEGLCKRCKEIIEWKIKYKKYKPLTKPSTCVRCKGKTVKRAYYIVCQPCATDAQVCAKCNTKKDIELQPSLNETEKMKEDAERQFELKQLTERQRRSYLRQVEKGDATDPPFGATAPGDESEDEEECSDECDGSTQDDDDVSDVDIPDKAEQAKFS